MSRPDIERIRMRYMSGPSQWGDADVRTLCDAYERLEAQADALAGALCEACSETPSKRLRERWQPILAAYEASR